MMAISNMIGRLRSKVDLVESTKDSLTQDGTQYTVVLTKKPVISGTDEVYITHTTNTTGLYQFVPRNGTQSSLYSSGNNLTYAINYTRGELSFYQGSGTVVASTGLVAFAPWNASTVIAYYDAAKYSNQVLSDYISYAVASVEAAIQIGMFVSGVSGVVPPVYRTINDSLMYKDSSPYATTEKFIIAEDVEILQELIAQRAALDLLTRERRVGAGNAIKIVDGDTQIDTSVNQRYLADFLKDVKNEYHYTLMWVMNNMFEGYNLRQIDERANEFRLNRGPFGTMNDAGPVTWD